MRIGFVIYGSLDQRSGGYLYDRQLVKELQKTGDQLDIISIPRRSYARNIYDNFSRDLWTQLSHGDFDLLLQDELNHPSLFAHNRRLQRTRRTPIVTIAHHLKSKEDGSRPLQWLYERVERAYLNTLDGVICNSQVTRRTVQALSDVSTHVMLPGRDHIKADMSEEDIVAKAMQGGPLRLLFLGNLIRRKSAHTLLDALEDLPQSSWRLRIVGDHRVDERYTHFLNRRISTLGSEENVRIVGPLSADNVVEELKIANVLVIPSQYEGFGIAYLEAMGFGVVPVATTAGGASELVKHEENGFLVDPGNVEGLTRIIQGVSLDRNRLCRLSLSASQTYHAHPTWAQGADKVGDYLKEILNAKVRSLP